MKKRIVAAGVLTVGLVTLGGGSVALAHTQGGVGGHGETVAQLLGITSDELRARVQSGESPRDLLEAAGVTKDDVRAAKEQAHRERLAQAVADGRITQEEADERLAHMAEKKARHEAARIAIENNDYDAWSAAVAGTPMAEKINAGNFSQLVEAHALRAAGDHEGAKAIMQELGIEKHHGGKRGFGHRGAFKPTQ